MEADDLCKFALDPNAIASGHNPDRLTQTQVGIAEGWRLPEEDEITDGPTYSYGIMEFWFGSGFVGGDMGGRLKEYTYRTRLTRAELRAARGLPTEPEPEGEQTSPITRALRMAAALPTDQLSSPQVSASVVAAMDALYFMKGGEPCADKSIVTVLLQSQAQTETASNAAESEVQPADSSGNPPFGCTLAALREAPGPLNTSESPLISIVWGAGLPHQKGASK